MSKFKNFINFIYFIIILFFVRLIIYSKIKLLEHKTFQLLGTYSLYVYLIHQKIGYIIMCIFHGSFFYIYYVCYNRSLQLAPVSKIVIISYSPSVVIGIVLAFVYSICAGLIFGVTYNKIIKSRLISNH